jgi:carbonic anhydrase
LNKLYQFHFHAPSEHTLEGKTLPLELHIIHVDAETGGFGTVVGIFFEISEDPNFDNFYFD